MIQSLSFEELVSLLKQFTMSCAPSRESEIENALESFLKANHVQVKRQVTIKSGRLDLKVGDIIIEIKHKRQKGIATQLDRYSGYCDGLIVVCWKATDPLKKIFIAEKRTAEIMVESIEVRRSCEMI